jgi:rfaE bifunctional protein nucleotidyltransferase chain/domain
VLTNIFYNFGELKKKLIKWKNENLKIVFTNGCFDILHRGHVEYLAKARTYGDILIVGINSDSSVKKLKGLSRPFMNENDRSFILAGLKSVDVVIIFDEDTPYLLINKIIPDVLVKGGDYKEKDIIGRDIVEKNGGKVITVSYVKDNSTSSLIEKIKKSL